jgi:hypothetical protein
MPNDRSIKRTGRIPRGIGEPYDVTSSSCMVPLRQRHALSPTIHGPLLALTSGRRHARESAGDAERTLWRIRIFP